MSPNANSNINADIFCEISASENPLGGIGLFWRPGWKYGIGDMDKFDNVVKWKADYTRDWIENKLVEKVRAYDRWQHEKGSLWTRFWKKIKNNWKF